MTNEKRKSQFQYGDKALHDMSYDELLDSVEGIWDSKNNEIAKLDAENRGLRSLLQSPLPIHSLWRGFAENAMLIVAIAVIAYLAGVAK